MVLDKVNSIKEKKNVVHVSLMRFCFVLFCLLFKRNVFLNSLNFFFFSKSWKSQVGK